MSCYFKGRLGCKDWTWNGEKTDALKPATCTWKWRTGRWVRYLFSFEMLVTRWEYNPRQRSIGTAYGQLLTALMFQPYFCSLYPPGAQHSSSGAMLALCSGCMHEHSGILDSFDIDRVLPVSGRSVNVSCHWNAAWHSPLSWFLALSNPVQPAALRLGVYPK